MKPIEYTPWQRWAQEYQSNVPTFLHDDPEEIDKFSHAAWHECKRRVIELLKAARVGDTSKPIEISCEHIAASVIEEIEKL